MASLLDIMARLTTHLDAASQAKGEPVTKTDVFYEYRLRLLNGESKAKVVTHCKQHGCSAVFGKSNLGGPTLELRRLPR